MQKLLDNEQLPGIPKAPATMMEVLLSAGVFEAKASDHLTWSIQPPGTKAPIEAAKLLSVAILYPGIDLAPTQLKQKLLIQPVAAATGPLAAPPAETIAPSPIVPPSAHLPLIADEGLKSVTVTPAAQSPEDVSLAEQASPTTTDLQVELVPPRGQQLHLRADARPLPQCRHGATDQ